MTITKKLHLVHDHFAHSSAFFHLDRMELEDAENININTIYKLYQLSPATSATLNSLTLLTH